MIRSFRARLTFWNVVILAVALLAFGGAMVLTNSSRIASDIDRELMDRARGPGMGPFGRGGRGGPGPGPGPGPEGQNGPNGPGAPFMPGENPNGNGPLGPGDGRGISRRDGPAFNDLRRPRRFARDGQPMQPDDLAFDAGAIQRAMKVGPIFSNVVFDEIPMRVFTIPLRDGDDVIGAIQVARDTTDSSRLLNAQLWTLVILVPLALAAAAGGALFLTGRAIRPIAQMRETAAQISEKDLSKRLTVEGHDELADLAASFNAMVDRLESAFGEMRRAYAELEQSHETQRRFTADASHELKTPLTRLQLAISSALEGNSTPEEQRKSLLTATGAVKSMARLVSEMLVLAKADAGQLQVRHEPVDLRLAASNAVSLVDPDGTRIHARFSDSAVTVSGDADHLERVALNLLENAVRHSDEAVDIEVSAADSKAVLKVSDRGQGISPEHLPHVTERFYRADESRSRGEGGVGLGLAICKTIIEAHGGVLEISSVLGEGTKVEVFLPMTQTQIFSK